MASNMSAMLEFEPLDHQDFADKQDSTSNSISTNANIKNILESLQPDPNEEQHVTEKFNPLSLDHYPFQVRQQDIPSAPTPKKLWYESFFCFCDSPVKKKQQ